MFKKKTAEQNMPSTSLNWIEVKKLQRKKYLTVALFFGTITAFYSAQWYISNHQSNQMIEVVRAKQELSAPITINEEMLEIINMPVKYSPANAAKKEEIIGKALTTSLSKDEIILTKHIRKNVNPNSITAKIPEGKQIFVISENWFQSNMPPLKAHDIIDILVSNPRAPIAETKKIVENVEIISVEEKNSNKLISILANDAEAKNIMYSRSIGLPITLIIHSR